jgi:hypothetical protein
MHKKNKMKVKIKNSKKKNDFFNYEQYIKYSVLDKNTKK